MIKFFFTLTVASLLSGCAVVDPIYGDYPYVLFEETGG